ncbi:MAG: prevent-host-death protein [Rhizobium sp.]|nr:prevent-host-death protein [Rhizobium sp.]
MKVSSAEFIKNYGSLSDTALNEPVTITRNGRERLVLISVDEYARLRSNYRRALLAEDMSQEDLDLIANARVPDEHAHLDELLKDWSPDR